MQIEKLKMIINGDLSSFIVYLEKLIQTNRFDDGEVLGIAVQALKDGPESLSNRQWILLLENVILSDKYIDKCERCAEDMPWLNMYNAIFIYQDFLCDNCRYMVHKINV